MKENKFKDGDVIVFREGDVVGDYIIITQTADDYVLVSKFGDHRIRVLSKKFIDKNATLVNTVEDKPEKVATTLSKEDDTADENDYDEKLVHEHRELTTLLNSLYKVKNKKYGDSFGQSVREFGYISALTRMSDKYNRLKQLIMSNQTGSDTDESLEDTLVDLANYCLMTVMEINHAKEHCSNNK